ncbi:MAG: DUF4388 domain-containing protein [Polyangia bacterium]
MSSSSTGTAEWLLEQGVISTDKFQGVLRQHQQYGGYIEDALVDINAIEEETLLKQLARRYKTRFVTTAKLKRAEIGGNVLEKVPAKFASERMVFPILYDDDSGTLSVVSVNPADVALEEELIRVAGATKVRMFVARPAAIKAAISKFYKGDIHAFASLDKEGLRQFQSMMNIYERNLLDEGEMAAAVASSTSSERERTLSPEEMERRGERASVLPESSALGARFSLEMVRLLISLLESSRGGLSGHSVLTASYTERMCRRIGLAEFSVQAITLAALIHDVGKGSPYHLTAFNVAEWSGHRVTAEKRYDTPIRLFESARLPAETVDTLRHMYERFDGKGFPEGRRGTEIPLGSRVLAMSDTFAELTSYARNPYRRILDTDEAMAVLEKGKGTIFDNNLVDLFATVVAGHDLKRKLLTGAQTVLVVDSNAEQCAILEMQLVSRGFKVSTAHGSDTAIKGILESPPDLVLSEVDLKPFDGFELKRRLDEDERTRKIPLVFFTARAAAEEVEKGFSLGAKDYIVKPSNVDLVATKIQNYLQRDAAEEGTDGVSGSLTEMSLPDLVQILSHGRKTGRLSLVSGRTRGEIHFVQGEIHNAMCNNLRGEEAFFELLKMRDGRFALDPKFTAESRMIQMTSEMLLLEGLRRYDEENR